MKHAISYLLFAAILLSAVGCGGDAGTSDTTTADSAAESTTSGDPRDSLPALDMGGENFNIYLWEYTQMVSDEENGDIINDAVYRRNRAVEELYNVNFEFTVRDGSSESRQYPTWLSTLTASVMAGDNSIQLAGGYAYRLALDSLNSYFHNLADVETLDFSQPWWWGQAMEAADLGKKMFLCFGNVDPQNYNVVYTMYYNKRLAEGYSITDLYDLVLSGKWTMDKLIEYSALAASDLNGDSKMDQNDQFGFLTGNNMEIDGFVAACDVPITTRDADGIPQLVGLSEKYVDVQQKLNQFIRESGTVLYGESWDMVEPFMNGQGLFMAERIQVAHTMREMNDDFGILPYPKWDEAQKDYYTHVSCGNNTAFLIPNTANAEEAGAILNALCCYGYYDVMPEYIERALKGKAARDEESAAILDIIFDNISIEFTQIYSFCFGNQAAPSMMMRQTIKNNVEIASMWESLKSSADETMKTLIESLTE
ncbi:MAG: extracellular solute-binding protein [Ruminococcaceae bacterium]|nr:extracellular solute-binding protein [Oscillospiraceae bacterium]